MLGFPVKVSWPNIASLPRNVPSSSQQIPSEVSDFPIPIAFSRHWGASRPPTPPAIYVPAVCYAKCNCKAGAGGCCKHVAAVLYQLVEYTQLCLSSIPTDKTCTDVLQIWHVPGEAANDQPTLFSNLRFVKENLRKDTTVTRRRTHVTGTREFCATPILANKEARSAKLQKLSNDLYSIGQGTVLADLIKGSSYEPSSFYTTSITEQNEHKDKRPSRTSVKEALNQLNGDCH